MGGEIGVESELGKGSTFWFTIHYNSVKKVPVLQTPVSEYLMSCIDQANCTILVAEDNISNFKLLESLLKRDYRIIHACNGAEAVELFKEYSPHIVLMDVHMYFRNINGSNTGYHGYKRTFATVGRFIGHKCKDLITTQTSFVNAEIRTTVLRKNDIRDIIDKCTLHTFPLGKTA